MGIHSDSDTSLKDKCTYSIHEPMSTEANRSASVSESVTRWLGLVTERVRLWWLIPFRFVSILVGICGLLIAVIGEGVPLIQPVTSLVGAGLLILTLLMYLSSFLIPVAVYVERKRLPDAGWSPSRWYYLMTPPTGILALMLTIVYTKRRLHHYGNDSHPVAVE